MEDKIELKNTKLLQFIVDDRFRILRHAVLLLATALVIFCSDWQSEYSGLSKFYRFLCVYALLILMSYVNMFILVPRYFFRGKYVLYLIFLSALVFLCQRAMSLLLNHFLTSAPMLFIEDQHGRDRGMFEGFIILIPIILVTTMIKLFQRWTRDNERIAELNNVALRTELNELKNQINPHFLFNMLNGIKALVRTDPEKASFIIVRLSEFLRYQLYENNDEKALLKSEITFLSNFLNLEMIRRDNLDISISVPEQPAALQGILVPPNLFTTFVENAVKHSVDIHDGHAHIALKFWSGNGQLHFRCSNSKDPGFVPSDQKNSGLGLANIKRRLTLLYQEDYTLTVEDTDREFTALLILPI